ncbi:MAG TPA: hypothetical protein VG368_05785 [Acidimicrobiales bacterium]|nr:hypothetical protein [Acidimicrobiales bacterium]
MRRRPLTLLESADLLGRYRYVELAAFAAIGARVTKSTAPDAQRYLASASLAHGWRAGTVEARLPVSVGLPGTDALTRSPSPQVDRVLALCVEPGPDVAVLDALVRGLYPAMAAAYRERISVGSSVSDGPVVRALGRIVTDLDVVRGEGLTLIGARDGDGRADRIAGILRECGGPFGPLVEPVD